MKEVKLTKSDVLMFCEVYVQIGTRPLLISAKQLSVVTGQPKSACDAMIAEIKDNPGIPTDQNVTRVTKILPLKYIKKITKVKEVTEMPVTVAQKKMFPREMDPILFRFKEKFPGYRFSHAERQVVHTLVTKFGFEKVDEAVAYAIQSDFWQKERKIRQIYDLTRVSKTGENSGKMYIEIIINRMIKERSQLKHLMTAQM